MNYDEVKLKNTHNKAKTIAIVMMAFPIVIALIGETIFKKIIPDFPPSIYNTIQYVIIGVTAVIIVLMIVFRHRILAGAMSAVPLDQADKSKSLSEEDQFLQRLLSSFLITFALCCSVAINGLVLYMLGKDGSVFYGFIGASFFLMLVQFPKYDDWETRLKHFLD